MPRVAFVYSDRYVDYHLSDTHPLQQKRLLMTHRKLDALGAFRSPSSHLITPVPATEIDLRRVHSLEYLNALRLLSTGETIPDKKKFGFGTLDNPPFPGMWEASLLYAGGSLDCARLVMHDGFDAAFNTSGGLHHARHDRAAGFCTVADCALVACYLLDNGAKRIAYVDIDAHHGDGMQAFFYDDPRVLTLSIHETPETLYPRVSGFAEEIGEGAGLGYNANLPMAPGSGDEAYLKAFEAAFVPLLTAFDPEYIILQVGADAHFADPLTHLSLTSRGWLGMAQSVIALSRPVIALGGGGYNLDTVARLWTLLYGTLSGQTFPESLNDNDGPNEAEAGAVFQQIYAKRRGTARGTDARDYARRSVEIVRHLVFPWHGLTGPLE
ncbi:MAG: acetoin utilization protein AcuC [Janthinobacterium lividum]